MRRPAGDEHGFSLVELLIVIGMLGALTGVVMFSLQAFDGGVRTAADEIEAVDLAVGCDAGHGDVLVVAGCSGPAAPAGPPLPDLSGSVEITSADPDPSAASEPLTVAIQVTDARGEPLAGAFVRVEVHDGTDPTGPLLASAAAPSTDASGATGYITSRDSAGALTIVACIGTGDAPPDECASAPGGVSEPFTRMFQVRPRLVFWDRRTNASLVAIWDVDVSETVSPAPASYVIYASAQACADGVAPLASGTARAVAAGSGGTTLELDLSSNALPQGQMAARRLQILDNTEHTPTAAGGLGNRRTPCLPFGNVPEAQTISVSSANGNSPIGNQIAHTVTLVDDQGRPFTGASVRYEITSDAGSPTLAGSPGALTDGTGETVFGYTRRAGGTDTIRVCTQANGGLPTSCAAASGPQTTITRTWVTTPSPVAAPQIVAWNRVGNDTIQVTWNTDVDRSPAPPADDYRLFATPTDCAAGSPAAAGTSRMIVPGTGGTTVRVAFPAKVVKQRGMADRRLTVGAETETNTAGTGNAAVDCLAPTTVPVPATLLLDPASGDSAAGADLTLTATLAASDGAPFAGAQLLLQVSGAEPVADRTAATDASGAAAFTYSRAIDSDDDLVVCTNDNGSLPASCLSATGPSGTAARTWFTTPPTPTVASWSRVSNAAIEVVWNTDVRGTAADAAGYRMFDASGACPAGVPLDGGAGETREVVSGTDGTTVLITFGRNVTKAKNLDDRRLQVVAETEANTDRVGNPASDCLPAS